MKKRSLFAAVAMLIVSAIVLTSATYAWFSAGQTVSVSAVYASVSNTDSSLSISAYSDHGWKPSLAYADLNISGNNVGSSEAQAALSPVSCDTTANSTAFYAGSIESGAFTSVAADGTEYVHYTCWVKADSDTQIQITPSLSHTSCSFIYGMVKCDSSKVVLGDGKYYPVVAAGDGSDSNGNKILDDDTHDAYTANNDAANRPSTWDTWDSGLVSANLCQATNDQAMIISLTGGVAKQITVYMWAEGQDRNCKGTVASTGNTISLSIGKYTAPSGG